MYLSVLQSLLLILLRICSRSIRPREFVCHKREVVNKLERVLLYQLENRLKTLPTFQPECSGLLHYEATFTVSWFKHFFHLCCFQVRDRWPCETSADRSIVWLVCVVCS